MEKRIRSPNYPALSLKEAVEKVEMVYRSQHTHFAPRIVIAKGMGYASLNGASATAISALHKYGLLHREGDEVKVSDRAMRILHPHSPDERKQALVEAAASPQLFAELAEKFPGPLPSEEVLRNYLLRNGFAPSAVSQVILAYRETSEFVAREGGSYISGLSAIPSIEEPDRTPSQTPRNPGLMIAHNALISQQDERTIAVWTYDDGSVLRIVASGSIETEDALDMVETLVTMKRAELRKRKRAAEPSVPEPANHQIEDE